MDFQMVGCQAPILISLPYITMDVKTSMMFFRPQVGDSMRAFFFLLPHSAALQRRTHCSGG